jgi:hypothetical protein
MLVQVLILIKIKLNKNVIFKSKMVRASAYSLAGLFSLAGFKETMVNE